MNQLERKPLLTALGLFLSLAISGCEQPRETYDQINLTRGRGMGFCIQVGEVRSATLAREAEVDLLEAEVVVNGDPETDDCLQGTTGGEACLVARGVGPIELTAEERAEVDVLLADLPLSDNCDPDPFLACDPCVVPTLDVDGDELSTDCCGDLPDEDADAIRAFMGLIDDLAMAAYES